MAALILTSCGGSDSAQQGESESDGDTQGMDHGETSGMDHDSMDQGVGETTTANEEVVNAEAAGASVELASEPAAPQPGQPVTLSYRITDKSGQTLTNLPLDHERGNLGNTSQGPQEIETGPTTLGATGEDQPEITQTQTTP